ncbi:MAG: SCO family protein [Pyrinomonadaceae bacterium]|nr:SCO family protein [Pyrinomonadaceae bacterium]
MSRVFRRGGLASLFLTGILSIVLGQSISETGLTAAQTRAARARKAAAAVTYECPMHPEVTSKKRGKCPKCGMFLRTKSKTAPPVGTNRDAAVSTTEKTAKLEETGQTNPSATSQPPGSGASSAGSASYFPNHVLITQDNKPVRFYDDLLKGKVALINFIFTTCEGVCSPMTANLARVQSYLAEHLGREVVMISISVDPMTDTPERLKTYAEKFKIKPGWYFLTGKKENVDWVLYKMGGYVEDKAAHSSVLIIGNEATGEWMKVHAMSNPTEIASAVTKLLAPKPDKVSP